MCNDFRMYVFSVNIYCTQSGYRSRAGVEVGGGGEMSLHRVRLEDGLTMKYIRLLDYPTVMQQFG